MAGEIEVLYLVRLDANGINHVQENILPRRGAEIAGVLVEAQIALVAA